MTRLCYEDQINAIIAVLKSDIHKLDTLPPEEAKMEARKGLMKAGIVDSDGNFTPPYFALGSGVDEK